MAEKTQTVAFIDYFSGLQDPRQAGKVLFPLGEIMLLMLCGVLAGAEGFVEIVRWGEINLDFLRRFLPYEKAYPATTPSTTCSTRSTTTPSATASSPGRKASAP